MNSDRNAHEQLYKALLSLKQLPFQDYSATEVTKALILVEMALRCLESAQKRER